MMVAFITEPIWLAGEITTWMYPPEIDVATFSLVWSMIDIVCAISSISNLMFISIDRYFAIKHPLIHHTKMTTGKCKWIILLSWIHAVGTSCLFLINQQWKYLVIFIFGFLIPLLIILFCYGGILDVVFSRSRLTHRHGRRLATEYKTAKSLGVVTGAFVACWLPFFLTSLSFQYCESCQSDIMNIPAITSAVKWLHYLNSCLNPIIYAFLNPTFKIAFRNLIGRMCGKESVNSLENETSVMSGFTFRRRDTYNSLRSNNSGKGKSENVPNGSAQCHKSRHLKQEDRKANGTVVHDSISDGGSEERGSETPEFCPTTPPPSYEDCYPLQNSSNNNTLQTGCSDVPELAIDDCTVGLREACSKQDDRTVSFSDEVKICGEKPSDKQKDDLSTLQGHFSTYHDKERNQTFLLVDGVTIPEGEIRTTDV
ncbi:Beta-2 adrenergic receptor [Desmophyllum pertusum]|uniref:Beta-2 adrenergic receptor n=1 Tax=Desmophyllum pertusum TaxID=174260 RepID=A0A9X0A2B9_9CNID|nr:Beta-2 adrenergic receptor [Desmophyllum pertusum]